MLSIALKAFFSAVIGKLVAAFERARELANARTAGSNDAVAKGNEEALKRANRKREIRDEVSDLDDDALDALLHDGDASGDGGGD